MNTYLVSYDLRAPGKDYTHLIPYLKKYANWAKPLKSVWFVQSPLEAVDVLNEIRTQIDANDGLLVVNVTKDSAAWVNLGDEITNWIKANL